MGVLSESSGRFYFVGARVPVFTLTLGSCSAEYVRVPEHFLLLADMPSILSVSYDHALMVTREQILKTAGHSVTSACGLAEAIEACSNGTRFDLLLLGHSLPHSDKETLIKVFRASNSAPVLALKRPGDEAVSGADVVIEPDHPQVLLDAVAALTLSKRPPFEGVRPRAQSQAG